MKGQSGSFFLLLSWNLKAWIRLCMRKAIYFYWVNCKHLVLKTLWAFVFSGLQRPPASHLAACDFWSRWQVMRRIFDSLTKACGLHLRYLSPVDSWAFSLPSLLMNWFGGKMWGFTRIYNHCWIELLHSQNSIHITFIEFLLSGATWLVAGLLIQ